MNTSDTAQTSRSPEDYRIPPHEKAAIEDQRAELIRSAAILSTALDTGQDCQTGLYKLISALAEEDYLYLQGSADRIFDTCEEAERQFQIAQKAIGG